MTLKASIKGFAAVVALLIIYFGVVSLISGFDFALSQFRQVWYFIIPLSLGFGVQVALYIYLKNAVNHNVPKGTIAATGTTSTAAMISCCAHYLVNVLPVLGTTGVIALVGQYQTELFWVGLAANAAGIAYIANKVFKFKSSMK